MNKNRVIQLAQSGQFTEARDLCIKLCEDQPGDSDNWFLLGNLYGQTGEYSQAESCCRKALALNPDNPELHRGLGNVLLRQNRHQDAAASLKEAVRLRPGFTEAIFDLGNAQHAQGNYQQAAEIYKGIAATHPEHADSWLNLAFSLHGLRDHAGTATACRRVLALQPERVDAHVLLAEVLGALNLHEEALTHYQHACELKPEMVEYRVKLGLKQQFLGQFDAAFASYTQAITSNPDLPEARILHAMMLLLRGDFEQGWQAYKWRWKWRKRLPRDFSRPLWDGSELQGRTILLHPEQGYGDTIQFIRFAPRIKALGGNVIVEVPPPLVQLLENCEGIDRIVVTGKTLPAFDVHAPLMSLPGLLGTRIDTLPVKSPYITLRGQPGNDIKTRLDQGKEGLRVGIVWAGGKKAKNDQVRSCPLEYFLPLADIPGVTLFSLQKDADDTRPGQQRDALPVVELGNTFGDFHDTAMAIASLDLVISVDTAVAHLAGALARPVWVLLPLSPDWRWMLDRTDSPWYPSARLFRQARLGDWEELLERVGTALSELTIQRDS